MKILKCHPGIGPKVRGRTLVSKDNFSARYDLDLLQGVFSRPQHDLFGQSYGGRVLVFNTAKGGVASAWMLKGLATSANPPLAILFNRANTILAQGAALAGLTLCDRFEEGDITALIGSGTEVEIDPAAGTVTLLD